MFPKVFQIYVSSSLHHYEGNVHNEHHPQDYTNCFSHNCNYQELYPRLRILVPSPFCYNPNFCSNFFATMLATIFIKKVVIILSF